MSLFIDREEIEELAACLLRVNQDSKRMILHTPGVILSRKNQGFDDWETITKFLEKYLN